MMKRQNWFQLTIVQAGGAICLPTFLIGRELALNYGAGSALIAIVFGNLILMGAGCLTAWKGALERKSTAELMLRYFGPRGAWVYAAAMSVAMLGWFAVQLNVMAESLGEAVSISPFLHSILNVVMGGMITCIALMGSRGLLLMANVSMPLLIAMIGYAVFTVSGSSYERSDPGITFNAIPLVVYAAIGAVIDLPTFFREARSPRDGIAAAILLFGLVLPVVEGVGIYLSVHSTSEGLVDILAGGSGSAIWRGAVAAFLILAGWTTNQANLYSAQVSMEAVTDRLSPVILGAFGTLLGVCGLFHHLIGFLETVGIALLAMGVLMVIYIVRDRIKTTCTLSEGCDAPSAAQNSSGIGALTIPSSFCTASEASRSSESVQFISIRSLKEETDAKVRS